MAWQTIVTTTFPGPNANPIGAPWIPLGTDGVLFTNVQQVSNQAEGTVAYAVGPESDAFYSTAFAPNQFAQATIGSISNNTGDTAPEVGILLRASSGNAYIVTFENGSGSTLLFGVEKVVGGVFLSDIVDTTTSGMLKAGDVLRGEIIGNTINIYYNGTLLWSGTDDTDPIASGSPGIQMYPQVAVGDVTISQWSAGVYVDSSQAISLSGTLSGSSETFDVESLTNQIISRRPFGFTRTAAVSFYSAFFQCTTAGSPVPLPDPIVAAVAVRNQGTQNILVTYTRSDGTVVTEAPLTPGGLWTYWQPSESSGGIIALTLTGDGPAEVIALASLVSFVQLAIGKSGGPFTQGQTNATYTVTVTNNGNAPTSGLVTVTETLPAGLTLVSMSGTGWSVTGNVATRSDSLGAGDSYPPLTVTVDVSGSAASPQVNNVCVSGGGSPTNCVNYSTTINPGSSGPQIIMSNQVEVGDFILVLVAATGIGAGFGFTLELNGSNVGSNFPAGLGGSVETGGNLTYFHSSNAFLSAGTFSVAFTGIYATSQVNFVIIRGATNVINPCADASYVGAGGPPLVTVGHITSTENNTLGVVACACLSGPPGTPNYPVVQTTTNTSIGAENIASSGTNISASFSGSSSVCAAVGAFCYQP